MNYFFLDTPKMNIVMWPFNINKYLENNRLMLYHSKKVFHRIIGKYKLERAFLHATRSQVYNLQPLLSQEYPCHGLLTKQDHPWCKER